MTAFSKRRGIGRRLLLSAGGTVLAAPDVVLQTLSEFADQVRRVMRYSGGHPAFRQHCDAVSGGGYRELSMA